MDAAVQIPGPAARLVLAAGSAWARLVPGRALGTRGRLAQRVQRPEQRLGDAVGVALAETLGLGDCAGLSVAEETGEGDDEAGAEVDGEDVAEFPGVGLEELPLPGAGDGLCVGADLVPPRT